jgi:hypothetical protein
MDEKSRTWSLEELKWALQALALPAEAQQNLFPSFVSVTDELALDFDHWWRTAAGWHEWTVDQLAALRSLDALLVQMSAEKDAGHWTVSALANDPCWQEVRQRARIALGLFGWEPETPAADRGIYIARD